MNRSQVQICCQQHDRCFSAVAHGLSSKPALYAALSFLSSRLCSLTLALLFFMVTLSKFMLSERVVHAVLTCSDNYMVEQFNAYDLSSSS